MKWLLTLIYGHIIIAVGLLRGIEAGAYKPKALWFCMSMGGLALIAGFLYRLQKRRPATVCAGISALIVLGFYFSVFISQPEKDASHRVGAAILASIAQLCIVLLPPSKPAPNIPTPDSQA